MTGKEKAQYPEFIAYVDYCSAYADETGKGLSKWAMEEKTLTAAMRRMETVIEKDGGKIYLVDILGKTEKETELGEPLYRTALMTRVHKDNLFTQWHFRDEAHHESSGDHLYRWYGTKDGSGILEFERKEPYR